MGTINYNFRGILTKIGFTLLFFSTVAISSGQNFFDENRITNTFKSTMHINTPTTAFAAPYGFEFHIRHRFGLIKPDKTIISDFLGMDLTANIQFSFAVPLGKKTMVGVGRIKAGKTYDMYFKRLLLLQTADNKKPVTIAAYANVSANTAPFNKVSSNTFFEDGTTPFKNKFNHRLNYNTRILISRKFSDWLSLQVSPALIYRNLVPAGQENVTFAFPLSGAIKVSNISSFLFEYSWLINYKAENNLYPLSIGYQFGTIGHVFQIVASSSPALLESELNTTESGEYSKGEFYLGFNIKRSFWHKKKLQKKSQNAL